MITLRMTIDHDITATVSTRGRIESTLPLVITSILNQSLLPKHILIYDDNDTLTVMSSLWWPPMLELATRLSVDLRVLRGSCQGQVKNHQQALSDVQTQLIWRHDDDAIAETDVLCRLKETIDSDDTVVAAGPLILNSVDQENSGALYSSRLADIFMATCLQHSQKHESKTLPVEHLQGSSFLFKKAASTHGYNPDLSRVGHREETMFTHDLSLAIPNGKLLVATDAVVHHLRYVTGGIREESDHRLWDQDDKIFLEYLNKRGVSLNLSESSSA